MYRDILRRESVLARLAKVLHKKSPAILGVFGMQEGGKEKTPPSGNLRGEEREGRDRERG